MIYEIWDIESGNLVGSFVTEAEALAFIVEFGQGEGGPRALRHLVYGWSTDDGRGGEIALGDELIALARSQPVRLTS